VTEPARIAESVRGWWRRRKEQKAAEAAERSRRWSEWANSPEGQEYIAEYGTEDWESLH
jgi:hypothetical protein